MENIEQKLLSHLLDRDNYNYAIEHGLLSEYFYSPKEQEVFDYISQHTNDYGKSPTVDIIKDRFGLDLPVSEEAFAFLLDETLERHRRSKIQQKLLDAADKLTKEGSQAAVDVMQETIFDTQNLFLEEDRERDVTKNTEDRLRKYDEREAKENLIEGAIFGWPVIDNHTLGLRPGETCVVFARPGKGKSLFVTQMANNNWQSGIKPLLLTYEMEIDQIEKRMDCLLAEINPWRFDAGRLTDDEKARYKASLQRMAESKNEYIVAYPENRTVAEIARQVQNHPDCGLVIIDQLSFLEGTGDEGHVMVKNIVHDLDKVAKMYRVPIVLVTQGNRGGMDIKKKEEMQQLHNIAFSDSVGQYASMVLTLFQNEEMLANNEMQLGLVKFRRGAPATFIFDWDIDNAAIKCLGFLGENSDWYEDS